MNIIIRHDETSVDPSATYTAEQFEQVITALEAEYEKALRAEYPDADIEFERRDDTYSLVVRGTEDQEVQYDVQRILETVFETGNFWL